MRPHVALVAGVALAALTSCLSPKELAAVVFDTPSASPYPLDDFDRTAPAGKVTCPELPLEGYKGRRFRYHKPVRVHPAFAERLRLYEDVVVEVARKHYGRAPVRMKHAGTLACRRINGYRGLLSEHALGNGIDVVGFDLPALPRGAAPPADLPRALRRPFSVTLAHWGKSEGLAAIHARFLDDLARTLVERRDIFRVLLGPAYPGHKGHFHFDMAPYRVVAIWSVYDQLS